MFFIANNQLQSLRKDLHKTKKAAFAQGTRTNLIVQWKSFLSFCLYFNMPWLPADVETLSLYAQFLSLTFKTSSSIANYICGMKMLHSLTDIPASAFQAVELKLALRGLARLNPYCPKQASPITAQILSNFWSGNTQLLRQDVVVGSWGLVVTFNWTKTIQFRERKLLVPVVATPDSILCPVRAFKYMCQLVPAQNSSPAFVCPSSTGFAPVTYH